MKRIALALAATILFCNTVHAAYYDGAKLVEGWREYQKQESGRKYSAYDIGNYLGYIVGVADTLDEIEFSILCGATLPGRGQPQTDCCFRQSKTAGCPARS